MSDEERALEWLREELAREETSLRKLYELHIALDQIRTVENLMVMNMASLKSHIGKLMGTLFKRHLDEQISKHPSILQGGLGE